MITTGTPQRTLEELRTSLMIRTGAAAGASFGYPLFEEFLKDAQNQLFLMLHAKYLQTYNDQPANVGEKWYDLPDDCAMEKIQRVAYRRAGSNIEYILKPLIEPWMRSISPTGVPYRYEVRTNPDSVDDNPVQIEVYPVIKTPGTLRVYYERGLKRFTEPTDRATMPDELIMLLALFNAKSHFNKPDAASIGDQFKAALSRHRAANRVKSVHAPDVNRQILPEDMPYTLPPEQAFSG